MMLRVMRTGKLMDRKLGACVTTICTKEDLSVHRAEQPCLAVISCLRGIKAKSIIRSPVVARDRVTMPTAT